MVENNRHIAAGCWLIAGIPILVTFVQALFALFGIDALGIPVVGDIKATLDTIEVLDVAGEIFRENDVTVFALFILIAGSWLAVGIGMFGIESRQFSTAAAGLATTFFLLFVLVYARLFSANVPTVQLVGFVLVPLIAVSGIWGSVKTYDWEQTVGEELTRACNAAKRLSEEAEQTFDAVVGQALDSQTRELLQQDVPGAIDTYEQGVTSFRSRCREIRDDADRLLEDTASMDRANLERGRQLREEAESLRPEYRAEQLLADLRNSLAQQLRGKFAEPEITSRYGESYAVRNAQSHIELPLPELAGPPAQIGGDAHDLDRRLAEATESGRPLRDIAKAVERGTDHLDALRSTIEDHEATFAERHENVDSTRVETRETLDRIDDPAGERLAEILLEGRFGEGEPPVETFPEIDDTVEEAKTHLHDCNFETALRLLDEAAEASAQLKSIAVFVADSVVPTIQHGSGTVQIPDNVDQRLVNALETELQRTYDTSFEVTDGTIEVTGEADTSEPAPEATTTSNRTGSDVPTEDVLYLLRELRTAAAESESDRTITVQLGEFPEKFSAPAVVDELRSFFERQGVFESVDVPDRDPGFIELTLADGQSGRRVMDDLYEKYREQYG